ncbi:hypothetical protein MMC17_006545 [Xylographa soralifera]|nr:hypothetical protein [Xylographa soralifera]
MSWEKRCSRNQGCSRGTVNKQRAGANPRAPFISHTEADVCTLSQHQIGALGPPACGGAGGGSASGYEDRHAEDAQLTSPSATEDRPDQQINLSVPPALRNNPLPQRSSPPNRIARRSIFRAARQSRRITPPNLWNPLNSTNNAFNPLSRHSPNNPTAPERSRLRNLSESHSEHPLLPIPPQVYNFRSLNSLVVERFAAVSPTSPRPSIGLPASARPNLSDPKGKGKQPVYDLPVEGSRQQHLADSISRPLPPLPPLMDVTKHLEDSTLSRDSPPPASLPAPSLPPKDTPPPSRGANVPSASHSPNYTHEAKPSTVSNDLERDAGGSPTPSLLWTERHPCYPHPNQHVPVSSPLYSATRIIRIPRDWMLVGDLAPTFSNTYPEILSPWVSEQEFRTLVEKLNEGLIKAMNPWSIRNWLDAFLGLATGWIWEDLGLTSARKGIRQVEQMLEDWNSQRQKAGTTGEDELVRVVGLRKTAYMTVSTEHLVAFHP